MVLGRGMRRRPSERGGTVTPPSTLELSGCSGPSGQRLVEAPDYGSAWGGPRLSRKGGEEERGNRSNGSKGEGRSAEVRRPSSVGAPVCKNDTCYATTALALLSYSI